MEPTVVDINDLSRSFGQKAALGGVSFRASAGQVYGLVGANGAGKTTLICICSVCCERSRDPCACSIAIRFAILSAC